MAGLAAAVVAGSQVIGGLLAGRLRGAGRRRTTAIIGATGAAGVALGRLALTRTFTVALALLVAWALCGAAAMPVRQAYLNAMIPSQQRATVLSFDSLMGSAGGVVIQPALGRAADLWSYGTSYAVGAVLQLAALPFLVLSRRERHPADVGSTPIGPADVTD